MRRGDVVVAVLPGSLGKPRPAVVVQADAVLGDFSTVALCPLTTERRTLLLRVDLQADEQTGTREPSQIMVDKIATVRRDRVRQIIGRIDEPTEGNLNRALMIFLGLA